MDKSGQAFPSRELKVANQEREVIEVPVDGMTLRDYFAGQALIGLLSNPIYFESVCRVEDGRDDKFVHKFIADRCQKYADAMLKHRGEG